METGTAVTITLFVVALVAGVIRHYELNRRENIDSEIVDLEEEVESLEQEIKEMEAGHQRKVAELERENRRANDRINELEGLLLGNDKNEFEMGQIDRLAGKIDESIERNRQHHEEVNTKVDRILDNLNETERKVDETIRQVGKHVDGFDPKDIPSYDD